LVPLTPRTRSRRGPPRRNKGGRSARLAGQGNIREVRIASVIKPYTSDPIISFQVRYQSNNASTVTITRAMMLNTKIMCTSGTTNYRIFQAVRLNSIEMTVAALGAVQWLSTYSPAKSTTFNATSTTAPGIYISRPPQNSLASFWSTSASNESEVLLKVTTSTSNDYLTASFSAVVLDESSPVSVTTFSSNATGQIYSTFFDGPRTGAVWNPVFVAYTD
jgi:hypothetical protein